MPRPALVRYAGLAGSSLLAVAAFFGGAQRPWSPTITPLSVAQGHNGVLTPVGWLAGTALLIGAWWVGLRMAPTARWAYLTAALWSVPLLLFLPLGSYDVYSYACQGWQQSAGLDPYAGGVDLLGCPWGDAVAPTWLSSPAPYGPVFLLLAAGAVKVGGSLTGTIAVLRVIAVLGVVLVGACLPALCRRTGVPLGRAVWLALACPLVPIHLVSGAHNDAVMVGFLVAGLALAAARFSWPAGVLLGLAIGVKATAVVAVPFAVLLLWPHRRKVAEFVAAVVLALGLVSLLSGRGFGWITGLVGSGASVQPTAPSTAVGLTIRLLTGADAVPVTRIIGIVVLAVVLVVLWSRAARHGDVLRYAALAMAATVVLAPVFHPWYATWPLALLAATLAYPSRWVTVPCAVASALCLPDGYNLSLVVKIQGAVVMTAFLLYLAYLAGKSVHEAKNRSSRDAGPDHAGDHLSGREA